MKNYKTVFPYAPEEWDRNPDWLARRLAFLWELREIDTTTYITNCLGNEKENLYLFFPDIVPKAMNLSQK
jgi:hypothetical protein